MTLSVSFDLKNARLIAVGLFRFINKRSQIMQNREGAKPPAIPQHIHDWYNAHYCNASYRAFRDALWLPRRTRPRLAS